VTRSVLWIRQPVWSVHDTTVPLK